MSAQTFTLPDLGEGLTEAEIVRWLVAVGDVVEIDQAIVEVETAKSLVEVPSPYAGSVSELHGREGEALDVGRPLISITAGLPPHATSAGEQYREEEKAGSGHVLIGYGTSQAAASRRRRRPRPAVPVPAPVSVDDGEPVSGTISPPRVSSPLVRRLAREAGLAIGDISGTGADGLVTRRDVQSAIARQVESPTDIPRPTPGVGDGERASEARGRPGLGVIQRTPLSGFRRSVAAALTKSRREIPEATVWVDVDFTPLIEMREQAKRRGDTPLSLLAYLARFTTAALRRYPELNGSVDTDRNELVQYANVNLGLAVQTERGLVVPAVLGADRLTTSELDVEVRRLTESARLGRATQDELTAGTFTLNNYGSFRVDGSAAIINPPQVAILGFGRVIDRPWAVDGQIVVRKIGQMSFVFDHRVCDGGVAAGFMRLVADSIEDPAQAIHHL